MCTYSNKKRWHVWLWNGQETIIYRWDPFWFYVNRWQGSRWWSIGFCRAYTERQIFEEEDTSRRVFSLSFLKSTTSLHLRFPDVSNSFDICCFISVLYMYFRIPIKYFGLNKNRILYNIKNNYYIRTT